MGSRNNLHSLQGRKESQSIKKEHTTPTHSEPQLPAIATPGRKRQHHQTVIIHTLSPKVIHAHPQDFMKMVQLLTGSSDTQLKLCPSNAAHIHSSNELASIRNLPGSISSTTTSTTPTIGPITSITAAAATSKSTSAQYRKSQPLASDSSLLLYSSVKYDHSSPHLALKSDGGDQDEYDDGLERDQNRAAALCIDDNREKSQYVKKPSRSHGCVRPMQTLWRCEAAAVAAPALAELSPRRLPQFKKSSGVSVYASASTAGRIDGDSSGGLQETAKPKNRSQKNRRA